MTIDDKSVPWNASLPILVSPPPSVAVASAEFDMKACGPSVVTVSGIVIDVRAQLLNAASPIVSRPLFSVTDASAELLENASLPIAVTLDGTFTEVIRVPKKA